MQQLVTTELPLSGQSIVPLVINLSSAEKRLAATQAHFDALGIPLNRVDAVNGRALQFPIKEFCALSYRLMHGRRTTPPEVGCYLSHVNCAKILLASKHDYALICEDDVEFDSDILHCLDLAIMNRQDWNILRLTTVNNHRMFSFKALDKTRSLAISLTRKKGAGAYLIDRKAANWIAHRLVPMRLAYDIAFDLEYLVGLKAAFISPLPAHQTRETDTQIQIDNWAYKLPRWRYFTVLPYRAWLESSRFLCRGLRLLFQKLRYRNSKRLSHIPKQHIETS
jgi:glycosyl transferase family 25